MMNQRATTMYASAWPLATWSKNGQPKLGVDSNRSHVARIHRQHGPVDTTASRRCKSV